MAIPTGGLTARSNNSEVAFRYSGAFGQPNGFGSVLEVKVNSSGDLALTLHYKTDLDKQDHLWSVMLTNEQRKHLAELLGSYDPVLWEEI